MVTDEVKVRDGSDYYKAVFGRRSRHESTVTAYDMADAEMRRRKSTREGRNALRDDGWQLDGDPTPEYRE